MQQTVIAQFALTGLISVTNSLNFILNAIEVKRGTIRFMLDIYMHISADKTEVRDRTQSKAISAKTPLKFTCQRVKKYKSLTELIRSNKYLDESNYKRLSHHGILLSSVAVDTWLACLVKKCTQLCNAYKKEVNSSLISA